MHTSLTEKQTTAVNPALAGKSPINRLLSLDVVRGITIAFMIMVNNNGGPGSWHFMNHADWNGLTPTDLVFPTFVFVVGVSVVFATEARLAKGAPRALACQAHRHPHDRADHLRHHRQQLPVLPPCAHAVLWGAAADRASATWWSGCSTSGTSAPPPSGWRLQDASSATGFSSAGFRSPVSAPPAATFPSWT